MLLVFVAFIALILLLPVLNHYRARAAVEIYRKQLAARGEKTTTAEIAPVYTAKEIAAGHELQDAINLGTLPTSNLPPDMKVLAPGRVLVDWKEEELPVGNFTNIWPDLRARFASQADRLATLRAVLEDPAGGVNLNYNLGPMLPLPHIAPVRNATVTLSSATRLELHDGHFSNALENLIACIRLNHFLEREPLEMSQFARMGHLQIAVSVTWEALQYPDWQDSQLAALQSAWASTDPWSAIESSVEMEHAIQPIAFDYCRDVAKADELDNLLNPQGKNDFVTMLARYPHFLGWKWRWSYDEQRYFMEVAQAGLETIRKLRTNAAFVPALAQLDITVTNISQRYTSEKPRFLFQVDKGFPDEFLLKAVRIEMQRRLLLTAIALQRFRLANGKYPEDLKELVPIYFASVPIDPMDGKPLRYHPKTDGAFLLYSVGEDGVDNGGDPTPTELPGSDNKYWGTARDAVWPAPAASAEVKTYKDKLLEQWNHKQEMPAKFPSKSPTPSPAP
jgi:hypothetical protein